MKKWLIIAPIGAAAAAAAVLLSKKGKGGEPKQAKPAAGKKQAKPAITKPKTGVYSFVSGFSDASTVDVSVKYDGDKQSFDVIGEEFLTYSSDSHVAAIYGDEVDMQLEYEGYYSGEGFAELSEGIKNKFNAFGTVTYAGIDCIHYLDGNEMRICLPIPGDAYSYILVTVLKHGDCKTPVAELYTHPEVGAILDSIEFGK